MARLIVPPKADVKGIVLDLASALAPSADGNEIQNCVRLVEDLLLLCAYAKRSPTSEEIFTNVLQGMLQKVAIEGDKEQLQL